MTRSKWLTSLLGLVTAMVFQIALGMLLLFFVSIIFSTLDVYQPVEWLISLTVIWLCFTAATAFVGWVYLNMTRVYTPRTFSVRFLASTLGILLPMVVLLWLGWRTGFDNRPVFQDIILDNWQPRLVSVSLALGLLGFYLPGWLVQRNDHPKNEAD